MMKTVVVVAAAATATAVAAKVELVHAVVKSTTLVVMEVFQLKLTYFLMFSNKDQ